MHQRSTSIKAVVCVVLTTLAALVIPTSVVAADTPALTITNPDILPGNSSVVFSKIQYPADQYQRMHNVVKLRVTNPSGAAVTVNSVSTTGPYSATPPWTLPTTLYAGQSIDVTVTFTATSGASVGQWYPGTFVLNSTRAGAAGSQSVNLTGWWQQLSEHGMEPRPKDLVTVFGWTTIMPAGIYSAGAYKAYSADEVLSPYWNRLDSSTSISMTQIASWRTYPSSNTLAWYPKGTPTSATKVFTGLAADAQSIMPRSSSWSAGRTTFTPGTATFGLKLDDEYTDPTLNNDTRDRAQGCKATQCGQHVRVFKIRDSAGNVVAGTYIFFMDIGGINFDYQDSVYIMTDLAPATS